MRVLAGTVCRAHSPVDPVVQSSAARTCANSQGVIVTNATHEVINSSPCTIAMARDVLRDPTQPVDRSGLPPANTPLQFIGDGPVA